MSFQPQKRGTISRFHSGLAINHASNAKSLGKMTRYQTEGSQDRNSQIIDLFSVNRRTEILTTQAQSLLNIILKKGIFQRQNAMKNLSSQINRPKDTESLQFHTKTKPNKSEKDLIKKRIRNSINRHSVKSKKQNESKIKYLEQSFTKVLKELKYKSYVKRDSENETNKVRIEAYGATIKGERHHVNQDSMAFSEGVYIICDGHGSNGKQVSEFVAQTAHRLILEAFADKKLDTFRIRSILKKVQTELDLSGIDVSYSGCTFVGVIIYDRMIYSVGVGDSKAILCNRITITQLSTLHKPDNPIQKARIQGCGASIHPLEVSKDKYSGPNRIWASGKNSWGPGLALSRAFGDKAARKYGVISQPEIKNILLTYEADFIVLGSDGLYDFMKDSQISFFIKKKLREENYNKNEIALDVVNEAKRMGGCDSDDISCIIIIL